ncbi:hypothetical protein J3R83DRAFT_4230 [Lanmaoa asiatica]|nr:hypothetical protein J3R83DRAFT_4230 [Lanmaoa asiatica]
MATKEFTVSLVSEPFVEAANVISVDAPEHVDMWALSGLTMARSVSRSLLVKRRWNMSHDSHRRRFNDMCLLISDERQSDVRPAWVKESAVGFECKASEMPEW